MPSKYTIRSFSEDGVYHIYNKGADNKDVFLSEQDYSIFLYYVYIYIKPLKVVLESYPNLSFTLREHNMKKTLDVLSYCLMPNHFHLLLRPHDAKAIPVFMKQLSNAYTQYFNRKYKRQGSLFQGRYKAVKIDTDNQLIHVSRYIHLNPFVAGLCQNPEDYPWSSYPDYLDPERESLCSRRLIQSFFSSPNKHKEFVSDHQDYALNLERLKHELVDLPSRG